MHTEELTNLGLSKNEAQIYETLVISGELSVSDISKKAKIHRRNVYDCLNRLSEKGLIIITIADKENHYKAVNPNKLKEMVEEKNILLKKIMPRMQELYAAKPHNEEIYILKGVEGWKNYISEILKVKKDVYTIGGGGLWADPEIGVFIEQFLEQAKKVGIKFKTILDHEVAAHKTEILGLIDMDYKFFPKNYSASAAIDIFGDHVVIMSKNKDLKIDDSTLTVIINQKIADAYRTWFQFMWDSIK